MGRRSDHSREELRLLMLDAADRFIAEEGVRAVTARGIAKAVGYSPGTIYNIFDDLDDLILQANARVLDDLDEALRSVRFEGDTAADLKTLAARYIRFTSEYAERWSALFEHRMADGQPVPAWYLARIARLMMSVDELLRPVFTGPEEVRARAVRVMWLSLHGICTMTTAGKLDVVSGDTAQDLIDMLIDNFLIGLNQQNGGA